MVKFVTISRGRSGEIAERTLRFVPDAIVCVAKSEVGDYEEKLPRSRIVSHPDEVQGIGPLRRWVIENLGEEGEPLVMLDDDIVKIYDQTGLRKKVIDDPEHVMAILERLAISAKDAGVSIFGFSQAARPTAYLPMEPIILNSWVGGVVGVVGKPMYWDENLLLRADIDACLKTMLVDRIIWVDCRYNFVHRRFVGRGGNNLLRSQERHDKEINILERRWGKYLNVRVKSSVVQLQVKVKR
jgi:hypothetical protein